MNIETNLVKYFCYVGKIEDNNTIKLTDINNFEIIYGNYDSNGLLVINNKNYHLFINTKYYEDVKITIDLIRQNFRLDNLNEELIFEGAEIFYDINDKRFVI